MCNIIFIHPYYTRFIRLEECVHNLQSCYHDDLRQLYKEFNFYDHNLLQKYIDNKPSELQDKMCTFLVMAS